jgi:hypothetical protein
VCVCVCVCAYKREGVYACLSILVVESYSRRPVVVHHRIYGVFSVLKAIFSLTVNVENQVVEENVTWF